MRTSALRGPCRHGALRDASLLEPTQGSSVRRRPPGHGQDRRTLRTSPALTTISYAPQAMGSSITWSSFRSTDMACTASGAWRASTKPGTWKTRSPPSSGSPEGAGGMDGVHARHGLVPPW